MAKRILPIDGSALEHARSLSRAQRLSNPAMTDDRVYAEAEQLLKDTDRESLNTVQDLLAENGGNLVELGERGERESLSYVIGSVSIGVFDLITASAADETQMRWIVYDTWRTGYADRRMSEQRHAEIDAHRNPTTRYDIKIDIVFRGRIRLREHFIDTGGFAMLEDARRVAALICWEGVRALRHYLFTDNLSGGRGFSSGDAQSLWRGYDDVPREIIDRPRPCDKFFEMLLSPNPDALNRAQALAVENNYRLTGLSSMCWRGNVALRRVAPDNMAAIGAFVLEEDCDVTWWVSHRPQDLRSPYSTDLEINYRGETFVVALGGGTSIGERCRFGAWFAWERAKMMRVELSKGTTAREWANLGNYALITGANIDETPEAIRNPAERSARSRKPAGKKPGRVVAKLVTELDSPFPPGSVIGNPEQLAQFLDKYMRLANECFVGVFLDIRNQVVGYTEFTSGLPASVEVGMSGLFQAALLAGAAGMVTVHNHPSGNPTPSDEDFYLWKRVVDVGKLLGIPVVDNMVIVRGGRYYSEAMNHKP